MADIVEHHGANHIFPVTIPEKRNNRDVTVKLILCVFFIIVGLLWSKNKFNFLVPSISYTFLLFEFVQICLRICNLFEESYHLKSRYGGDSINMIKETCSFININTAIMIIVFCVVCALGNPFKNIPESIQTDGILSWLCVGLGMTFFVTVIKLDQCPLKTAKLMDELKSLDYGSGMAYSFFYGYLDLILPCTGDERKGLKEQIEDYESKHDVKFATKKLYIFIPLSAYCPTTITQNSKYLEASGSLDWRRMDRAGVKERQYHNSVYKLWPDRKSKPIYVCAEYATPLLTLHEVMNQNTDDSRLYKKYQKEIVTNFYLTLHKVVKNNRDTRDLVELIYYRDVDNNGNPLNISQLDVGLLLLNRIIDERTN